ncbi:alanine dehydrogenase [Oceanospirillum multiglobuliferum]|uniref:Alanine dehydrogenase n=1 Tax=Oceanospirillum multiglobuliferum TaxID=64969 RepID=A0A1T4RAM8_9GAMM|nr:alanine dehydrogenase [Oceanospirillum multiglobuliferum]OPX55138.1 alanine dehydrogenase [Oceanospirillum multiglobuliferum]SKA12738.1 alanine dehydrogenase [Oceanospirillum multiglobuliferum]
MLIAVPKEIKTQEFRVGMPPAGVRELNLRGHQVLVEQSAGQAIGFSDQDYADAGAEIVADVDSLFARAEMIVKVKEPQPQEYQRLREGQILFTYLHLAADAPQTQGLIDSGCTAIAYETVTDAQGGLPLLAPMSEVAGKLSVQAGARCLEKIMGGRGVLLGGVPGVAPAQVTVIGGGVVGENAARMAMGLGASVTIVDRSIPRLRELEARYQGRLSTVYSTHDAILSCIKQSDLVIGAVLIPGAAAPKLVSREMLKQMMPGSVLVDVAIDQGGCFETSRATTHEQPTFVEEGVIHYCVANMPGAVARTSTLALTHATLPFIVALADKGWQLALKDDKHLMNGLNIHAGQVTNSAVAKTLGYAYINPTEIVG